MHRADREETEFYPTIRVARPASWAMPASPPPPPRWRGGPTLRAVTMDLEPSFSSHGEDAAVADRRVVETSTNFALLVATSAIGGVVLFVSGLFVGAMLARL